MTRDKSKIKTVSLSIRDKLILINVAFIILVSGVSVFFESHYFISRYKKEILENVFTHENNLKEVLENVVYLGMGLGELEGVDSRCAELIKSLPYGVYCFITDARGKVYYSADKKEKGKIYHDGITQRTLKEKVKLIQRRKMESGSYVYDLSMPIFDYNHKLTGVIRIGLSSDIVTEETRWIIDRFIFISLLFLIFVIAGVSAFNKMLIINPINRIINGLHKFSQGELGYRIKYKRRDEFGQLVSSLNTMAEQIALYQKEIISSRQYANSVIDNMRDSLIIINKEKAIGKINNATLELLGYREEELIGAPIKKIIMPDVFTDEKIEELLKKGYTKSVDTEYTRKDGTVVPVNLSVSFIWIRSSLDDNNFEIIIIARDMRMIKSLIGRLENTNAKLQESSLVLERRVRERTKELKDYQNGLLNILDDLKEAKEDIETGRKSFMDIVEKSSEGIIIVDTEGKILFVNIAACSLFGKKHQELEKVFLGIPLAPAEGIIEVNVLPSGAKELKRVDMRAVDTEWLGQDVYLLLLHDITERINFTETLKLAAQEWRSTFDAIGDMVLLLDKEGRIIRSNVATAKIMGLSYSDMKGKIFHNIFNPDVKLDQNLFIKSKEARLRQVNIIRRQSKWYSIAIDPIIDKDDDFTGATCIVSDITQEEETKEELRSTKSFVESIVEEARSMINVLDKEGNVISINRFTEELLGYERKDIIGKNWFDNFVHEKDGETSKREYFGCIMGKKVEGYENCIISRSNKEFVISWYASPLKDNEGKIIGVVALGYDVTDRKEIEEAHRLSQLGKLVADMAHEVNNPLMVISGRAQLSLMEEIENAEIKNNFNIIIKECQRAKDIIQRLLKFSRPSKGDITDIDINSNINEVISLLEHQFSLSNVQISKNYGQNIPTVKADSKQLQEVFMNLFNNARDAMPSGGVIEAKTCYKNEYVNIEIKDSGVGMSKEILDKAFDPFFTTKEKGTGLGLAMCYSIIKKQGGDMKFESVAGEGTTAIIRLMPKGGK